MSDNLNMEQTYLAKIKGRDPEEFMFITFNKAEGRIVHTSRSMNEKEIKELLGGQGMPSEELESKIEAARESAA